jgi:hypothetical protein
MSAVEFSPQSAGVINVEQSEAARAKDGHWSYNDKRQSGDCIQPHSGLPRFHYRDNIAVFA